MAWRLAPRPLALDRADLWLQRRRDRIGDLVLNREDVGERAIIPLGPDVPAAFCLDQLRGDADLAAGRAQTAFEHIAHAELDANLPDIGGSALVGEGGVAGDDEQPAQPRQA